MRNRRLDITTMPLLPCPDPQRLSPPRERAGRSVFKVQEFADVVKVEEGEGGECADQNRGGGIRAPFQPPRQNPRHRRPPLEQRRIALPFSHPVVESGVPAGQQLLRIWQKP